MPIIILLILLLLLFPPLGLILLFYIAVGLVFFLPFFLFFESIFSLIFIPWQIVQIATDKRVRQNHALEHATVNVIEEKWGEQKISGLAAKNGFTLMGDLPPHNIILTAAKIGLSRMKAGETNLAIHKRCGTSAAAANLLFAIVFLWVLFSSDYISMFSIIMVFILANLLSRPLGTLLQKYFTTTSDVQDIEIAGIGINRPNMGIGLLFVPIPSNSVFVHTTRVYDTRYRFPHIFDWW